MRGFPEPLTVLPHSLPLPSFKFVIGSLSGPSLRDKIPLMKQDLLHHLLHRSFLVFRPFVFFLFTPQPLPSDPNPSLPGWCRVRVGGECGGDVSIAFRPHPGARHGSCQLVSATCVCVMPCLVCSREKSLSSRQDKINQVIGMYKHVVDAGDGNALGDIDNP